MGPSNKRIALYTSLFAAGTVIACPAVGFGAGTAAFGGAVASIFGNTLASDIYAGLMAGNINSLANHDLAKLVGNSLALLIDLFEQDKNAPLNPNLIQRFLANFRRPEPELSALARAARNHWLELAQEIAPTGEKLEDHNIVNAFTEHDRTDPTPYLPKEDWLQYLIQLEPYAKKAFGGNVQLDERTRDKLADFITPRFAVAVRELVKADLDPSVGTGGRVFIGLHLDMMRQLSVGIGRLETKTGEQLRKLESIEHNFVSLRDEIVEKFNDEQAGTYFRLAEQTQKAIRSSLKSIESKLDALHEKVDSVAADVKLIVDRLMGMISEKESLIGSLRSQLEDAVGRLATAEQAGDSAAKQKLDELRSGGDSKLLGIFLDEQIAAQNEVMIDLLRERAAVAYVTGEIERALQCLTGILGLEPNDLESINRLGLIHQLQGDLLAAERRYNRLLVLDPPDHFRAVALGNLGTIALIRGELDEAEKLLSEALQISRQLGNLEGQANQLGNLGLIAWTRGELDEAEKLQRESLQIDRQLGKLEGQANALGNL
jgi:tetratricopeptide (TPR) repeat protein